jgi:RNA-directed DNA polymerase
LQTFAGKYEKCVAEFNHAPMACPVIVLVDNDDGGKKLFGLAKARSGTEVSFGTRDPFYHLGLNLYFVKTPEAAAAPPTSNIEDLFDAGVLAMKLDGKSFDPDKEHDAPGKYGKVAFATRVVEPHADQIDFSGFAPLLDRIVAVLDHHAALRTTSFTAAV